MKSPTQISREIGVNKVAVCRRLTPEFCTQYSRHMIIKRTAGGANRYLLDELAEQVIIKSFHRNDQGVLNEEERQFISKWHFLIDEFLYYKGLNRNDYYSMFAEKMVTAVLSLHTNRKGEKKEAKSIEFIKNPRGFFFRRFNFALVDHIRECTCQKRDAVVFSIDNTFDDGGSRNYPKCEENVEKQVELRLFLQDLIYGQCTDNLEKDIIKNLMYGLSPSEICKKRNICGEKVQTIREKIKKMYAEY